MEKRNQSVGAAQHWATHPISMLGDGRPVEGGDSKGSGNWSTVSGNWQAYDVVQVADVDRRAIYRSPEEPSDVAWVGIWKGEDGSISIRFPQITGNPGLEPSYAPWYGRATFSGYGMRDWEEFAASGSLNVGPTDALTTTQVHYITMVTHDHGDTWQVVSVVPSNTTDTVDEARGYNSRLVLAPNGELVGQGMATLLCRDGRMVDTAGWKEDGEQHRAGKRYLLGLRESFDNGKTWGAIQWISGKYEDGNPAEEGCEEHSFVELADGRLLFIIRSDDLQHPLAVWLTRRPDGQYACDTPVVVTAMPHAGMPNLIRTDDGTIWYWGARHYYSLDDGKTWQGLPDSQAFPAYYGKMVAAGDQVLCITQKDIADSPYPHLNDAFIEQIRFSGRRVGVMQQTDPGDAPALLRLEGRQFADLHLRADVKPDQAAGLAFHISPDGKSYYAFMVVMPDSEARKRWEPQPMQGATLSAYFPGVLDEHVRERVEKGIFKITPHPIAVLARVDNGQLTVLRGLNVVGAQPGAWAQLQVKICGDLIQAAFSDESSSPVYLGVHDGTYAEGAIGLVTDGGSVGSFKDLAIWPGPQMIRDLWTIPGRGRSV
ncbi:MAG: sialidase family protein [Candidatus Latescibacterota bacterium]